jgi:Flp pilus assembly protein TadG
MRSVVSRVLEHPRGGVAPMFAVLLPLLVGFVALAVDVATIAVARSQLSTAADAAALAGAVQLATENRVQGGTNLTAEISASNNQAIALGSANYVLGNAPVLNGNTPNITGGQIMVGYLDPNNPQSTLDTSSGSTALFNSVQVTMIRDPSHTGLVPSFFGKIMGFGGASVSVSSTAMAQPYSISGFQAVGQLNASLLPIVLDKPTWQAMMAGRTQDQYTYNASSNTVTAGADGITESVLYPVGSGSPGNWGTIKVGVSDNSTSTLSAQIQYGITATQLATFPNSTIQLDTTQIPPSMNFGGNPGISAGLMSALQAIIGKPVAIPIYDLNGSIGSNAWYRVIAFQACRILSVNFQGDPKYVIIQPALLTDQTAIAGSATSWTSGGVTVVQLVR